MRKMASIQVVEEIKVIENADKICAYRINGWWVVDAVGKYSVGDKVIYCEVDSWIPNSIAPFLTKPGHSPREFQGVEGERLRTVKLRGQLSQGLLLSMGAMGIENYKDRSIHGMKNCWVKQVNEQTLSATDEIGTDVSEYLEIKKWELQEFRHADAKGSFPNFFPKTDQDRIQNCYKDVSSLVCEWYVEEKIEGQSHSTYLHNDEFGVCSRNLELKDSDNTFWNTAKSYKLEEKLRGLGKNLVLQCEQCGPGISGNIYNLKDYRLFLFDVFDIDNQKYLSTEERNNLAEKFGLNIPAFHGIVSKLEDLNEILLGAEQKSKISDTLQEGFIYRAIDEKRVTFKVVSNKYLLKQK